MSDDLYIYELPAKTLLNDVDSVHIYDSVSGYDRRLIPDTLKDYIANQPSINAILKSIDTDIGNVAFKFLTGTAVGVGISVTTLPHGLDNSGNIIAASSSVNKDPLSGGLVGHSYDSINVYVFGATQGDTINCILVYYAS